MESSLRQERLTMRIGSRMKRIPLLLYCMSGGAMAAGNLPPLVVPADLLGAPAPRRPAPAPAPVEAPTPAAVVTPVPATAPTEVGAEAAPAAPGGASSERAQVPVAVTTAPGATYVEADHMSGLQDVEMVAEGNAVLRRDDLTLTADRLVYRQVEDEAVAEGNVKLQRGDDWMAGPRAELVVGLQTGEFETPRYSMSRPMPTEADQPARIISGGGHADTLQLEGENQYRLKNATWSTCQSDDPDWYVRARELELDYDRKVGTAHGGSVVFQDVPLFYTPWLRFPLVNQRQSGFLTPTFGTSNKTGVDLALPYYWNIAPNYDATFTPRYMGRRGLQLGGEFRYLTPSYSGTSRVEWLPSDAVTGGDRAAGSIEHVQRFMPGLTGRLNLNGVSDKQYFEDLSNRLDNVAQSNLVREGRLDYSSGSWWSASALAQSYQTLSGTAPYRRLPQFKVNALRGLPVADTTFAFEGTYIEFKHPDEGNPEGSRMVLYPQFSWPMERGGFSFTPKLGMHYTRYDLSTPVSAGNDSLTRALPIASMDGSVVFERDWNFLGNDYVQTLEPRLFYVYIPHREQSPNEYPIFDTAYYDFDFAQMFSENIFSGSDRVANANQLTAAITSRLYDPVSGAQRLQAAVGQRYYFADQRVLLRSNDTARTGKRADIVAALTGTVAADTTLDTGWQYNPNDGETERFSFDLRWQPGFAKALGIAWRYKRNASLDPLRPTGYRDIDITGQWPLGGRWYGVGRFNRSLLEHRTTEAIAGLEYDGGCWVFRTAFHRFATRSGTNDTIDDSSSTTALFVQLELNGLASVGSSPLSLLKRSVPGYGKINETSATSVFSDE
jgi:LPS-assembly protein